MGTAELGERSAEERLFLKESLNGKYSGLLKIIPSPEEKDTCSEIQEGAYEDGYGEATEVDGVPAPAGYWVYSYPNWYIWAKQHLDRIGFEALTRNVRLEKTALEVRFEFQRDNKEWARSLLELFARALSELEKRSGVPYPGVNPFVIREIPALKVLGYSGPTGLHLASPPHAREWVMLHEAVHIWNSGGGPDWICEGLADFVSHQLMVRYEVAFPEGEALQDWLKEWSEERSAGRDAPLNDPKDNYYAVNAGKAMEYWLLLFERYGREFVDACFRKNATDDDFTNEEFETMLKSFGVENPESVLQGWVTKGDYRVIRAR